MSQLVLVAGCLLAIMALALVPPPAEKVVFLDVGQGDAILLQAGTQQILIDGGPDATVLQRLAEELPWFDRKIEVVVATHPDKDHIGGLVHVLERYDVGLVVLPEVAHTSQLQSAWLNHIKEALDVPSNSAGRHATQYRFAVVGQRLRVSDMEIEVLHPQAEQAFGKKTNNASVSTRADFCPYQSRPISFHERIEGLFGMVPVRGEKAGSLGASRWTSENERGGGGGVAREHTCLSFLFTGDAESVIERQLAAVYGSKLDVDILKAGHHGSKTSTSQELIDAASPEAVVISAGRGNQYGHPHPDVLARLQKYQVWRTDEQGSVRFTWNKEEWLASTTH